MATLLWEESDKRRKQEVPGTGKVTKGWGLARLLRFVHMKGRIIIKVIRIVMIMIILYNTSNHDNDNNNNHSDKNDNNNHHPHPWPVFLFHILTLLTLGASSLSLKVQVMTLQQVVEAARKAFPVPGSEEIFLLKLVSWQTWRPHTTWAPKR